MKHQNLFYRVVAAVMLLAVLLSGTGTLAGSAHADGPITFTKHIVDSDFHNPELCHATDIDGDGDVDIVCPSDYGNTIAWWENDGAQSFTKHVIDSAFYRAKHVYATDVDGDGDVDVLGAAGTSDEIAWWENNGAQVFTKHVVASAIDARCVYATDLDDDGDVDILGADEAGGAIVWWENDGNENFTAHTITDTLSIGYWVHAADVDGDGDMDVLGPDAGAAAVIWWENDGAENFTAYTIDDAFDGPHTMYAVDMDGDGDMDILAAASTADAIAWWENDGDEVFTKRIVADTFDGALYAQAADFDGDCDMDILGAALWDDAIAWWENDGDENFTKHMVDGGFGGTLYADAVDIDGDGDPDILGSSYDLNDIAWYENSGSGPREVIVFTSSSDFFSNDAEIYMINSDGSNLIRLTNNSWVDWMPRISPDGRKISFCSTQTGSQVLYTMHIDGGNAVPITSGIHCGDIHAWSPDSTKIVFQGGNRARIVELATGNISTAPSSVTGIRNPDWSPDGSKLAFTGDPWSLYTQNLDGTNLQLLSALQPRAAAWSPDGDRFAYEQYMGHLRIINADGTNDIHIPTGRAAFVPSWSPDGTQIAYATLFGGQLRIINADGTNDHAVPNVPSGWIDGVDWGMLAPGNTPPTADADGPYSANEGDTVLVDASGSSDPDDNISLYEWDLDNDGQYDDATGVTTEIAFDDDGVFTVGLRVTDECDQSDTDTAEVTVLNVAPTVDAGAGATINEGDTFSGSGSFTDPGADTWEATVDYGDGSGSQPLALTGNTFALSHTYADNGDYTVEVCVTDDDEGVGCDTLTVTVYNVAPDVEAGSDATISEGDTFSGSGTFTDPGADTWGVTVDYGDGSGSQPLTLTGKTFALSHTYADNDIYTVEVCVTDDDGGTGCDTLTVTVLNVAPTVGAITAPADPVQVDTAINTSADFTDPGVLDTHTAEWDWGDDTTSSGTVNETNGSGSVSGSHTYTAAGVYTVKVTVTDKDGDSGQSIFRYVVIYDPEGGFVTGGGWINSPEGAYAPDPSLTGKANFGFVSKYKKGANVPTGVTEFQFKVADLNFHSDTYQWLVVAGPKAQFKGTGTINGAGNYGFMLTAVDAALTPSTEVDKFRIKIWDKDNDDTIVYDNQMGAGDDADPATDIGGGSIVIHKAK